MSANGSSSSTTAEIIQKLAGVNIIKGNEENGSSKKLQDPIVVVGGSYAGAHAARTLAKTLPPTERVILLEQRSHLAHLYVLPRFAVVEGYEEHAFIPYTDLFATDDPVPPASEVKDVHDHETNHHPNEDLEVLAKEERAQYIQSTVTRITKDHVTFTRHHHSATQLKEMEAKKLGNGVGMSTDISSAGDDEEEKGTVKLLKKRERKQGNGDRTTGSSPLWKVEQAIDSETHAHLHVPASTHVHTANGLITPPPSISSLTPKGSREFDCCRDCISPSAGAGCCQASLSSSPPSLGILTPQDSRENLGEPEKKNGFRERMKERGCDGCLAPSEICCRASSSSPASALGSRRGSIEDQEQAKGDDQIVPLHPDCSDCMAPNASVCCQTLKPRREKLQRSQSTFRDPIAGGVQSARSAQASGSGAEENDDRPGTETIRFKYLVYAAGSRLPHPLIRLPKKKMEAKDWLKENQRAVREASRVLVVGGGALGIQFASDIKAYFPSHHVTLINSRDRFLSIYHPQMHDLIQADLEALGVEVLHGERVDDLADLERQRDEAARYAGRDGNPGRKMVKTKLRSGAVVESDLQIICTGQQHNHELISQEEKALLSDRGSLNVKQTMQLDHPEWNHVFAIGDVANTTAIKAGHTGWYQAGVAAGNIVQLIKDGEGAELQSYTPTRPMIKVSVGKGIAISQMYEEDGTPKVTRTDDIPEDLQASLMWVAMGADTKDMSL